MSEPEVRWCSRCSCSVPLTEWAVTHGATALRHVGPMRDHDSAVFVEPDEEGHVSCDFVEPIPEVS